MALTTIDEWIRRDCPVRNRGSRGKPWTFNTADVAEWREQRARDEGAGVELASKRDLELRRLAAQTGREELAFAIERKAVAPVAEFERAQALIFAGLRSALRQLPTRVAPRIVGEADDRKVKALLRAEIDQVLDDAASGEFFTDEELAGDDEEEAA